MSALFNCRSSLWFLTPHSVPDAEGANARHFREIFGELKRKSDFCDGTRVHRPKEFI